MLNGLLAYPCENVIFVAKKIVSRIFAVNVLYAKQGAPHQWNMISLCRSQSIRWSISEEVVSYIFYALTSSGDAEMRGCKK